MQFENDEITLNVEYGDYTADINFHFQDYEGQKEQVIIDGEKTDIVSYDINKPINSSKKAANKDGNVDSSTKFEESEKNYIVGVNFPYKNKVILPGDRLTVSLIASCKTLEAQETAKTILKSIKFKQK